MEQVTIERLRTRSGTVVIGPGEYRVVVVVYELPLYPEVVARSVSPDHCGGGGTVSVDALVCSLDRFQARVVVTGGDGEITWRYKSVEMD